MSHTFRGHMERARRLIVAGGSEHPLRFLVEADGSWKGRWGRQHALAVQAGHATSKFSGLAERFLVEDADYNQMRSTPERQGLVLVRTGIEIGGVPVELETARFWQRLGHLEGFDLHAATRSWGW